MRDPVWVRVRCHAGGVEHPCGRLYTVNARTAPQINGRPYCRSCWDFHNEVRAALDWPVYEAPDGTWPEDDPITIGG